MSSPTLTGNKPKRKTYIKPIPSQESMRVEVGGDWMYLEKKRSKPSLMIFLRMIPGHYEIGKIYE